MEELQELELKGFREGFGFGDEGVLLKKNTFGGYNKREVEQAIQQLNQNCISMQKAFEEKNKTFTQGLANANQEAQILGKQIAQLQTTLKDREKEVLDYKAEIQRLRMSLSEMENQLDEVKHIRNDETILKENVCLQNQIEEDRREIEGLRVLSIQKDEIILQKRQEIEMIRSKAQADLNFAYRTFGFRMEKLKNMIADFKDTATEIDKTIQNKLEAIARGND